MFAYLKKIIFLFTRREKKIALLLVTFAAFVGVIEVVGVALIMPYFALITKPEFITQNSILEKIYSLGRFSTPEQFLLAFTIFLIVFYFLKNALLGTVALCQNRFVYRKLSHFATRLFETYIKSTYVVHLKRNSAQIQKILNEDIVVVHHCVILSLFTICSEIIVIILMGASLLLIKPVLAVSCLAILGALGFGLFWFVKPALAKAGKDENFYIGQRIKWVNQALGGLKDIKVLNKEAFFIDRFETEFAHYTQARMLLNLIQLAPRLVVETVVMVLLFALILVALLAKQDLALLIPTLALFGVAALRIMPSINRIVSLLTVLRFYSASLDILFEESKKESFPTEPDSPDGSLPFNQSIRLDHLSFTYPGVDTPSLKHIDLTVKKGSSVAFVGTSGAGKSTLVDVILGLLVPQEGAVTVDGTPISENLAGWRRNFGYVPQAIYLSDDSVLANVAFGIDPNDISEEAVWRALEIAQMDEFVRQMPGGLQTHVGERGVRLSGGQRQRLGIARALYHNPDIVILDEATSALDNETEECVAAAIDRLSGVKTLIVIAHRISTIQNCDSIYKIENGQLAGQFQYSELYG